MIRVLTDFRFVDAFLRSLEREERGIRGGESFYLSRIEMKLTSIGRAD